MAEPLSLSFKAELDIIGKLKKSHKLKIAIAGILVTVILVLFKFYILGVVLFLIGLAFILEPPEKKLLVKIDRKGIQIGQKRFGYHDIQSFWIHKGKKGILFLEPNRPYLAPIALVISEYEPEEVKKFLKNHLPEKIYPSERFFLKLNQLFGNKV